ncbi:hypothetical protein GS399_05175 [Pedobacter sp. HMF7647]|uniref:Methylamine utilisation protein MauE domain-containing protein n=1 Tax=Hufsiella arboris TaxID=2695275 RepID=A0A7K1Y707_9SPHI|nr:MauE/DoxX family redox-associated membrane protein [Hufsiella arboris]MXV50356.1 hypothetical protein [Hufsiella arboris]
MTTVQVRQPPRAGILFIGITRFLLILLFVYTATSKLLDWKDFQYQLHNQVFPDPIAGALAYLLPAAELITALLLTRRQTLSHGLACSLGLMLAFSIYTGLVLFHFFPRVPCSCGGVLKAMNWQVHFIFNIAYLLLTIAGTILYYKKEVRPNG